MRRLPETLKSYTAFVDGRGKLGRLGGGQLPTVSINTEEYRDGGMDGTDDLDLGINKLEWSLTFNELDRDALKAVGTRGLPITLRGSMEGEGPNAPKVPVVATLSGLTTGAEPGAWGDPGKTELTMNGTASYYRLTIGGEEIYEIDIINNVRRVGGVDQLAQRMRNLGY